MPTTSAHCNLAYHNLDLLKHLKDTPRFHDWMTTAAFYAALHIADGMLAREHPAIHSYDHGSREAALKAERKFQYFYKHFRPLQSHANIARYLCEPRGKKFKKFSDFMTFDVFCQEVIRYRLKALVRTASKHLEQSHAKRLQGAVEALLS